MAKKQGERRMLFDTRGRRRNVIRVVYAVLALLMGGSLFLTVGPFNLGELAGTGGSSSAEEVFEEQAERIEARLAKNPTDEGLLISLTRARINAGTAKTDVDPQTGLPGVPPLEAQDDYSRAAEAWSRYLKLVGDERANPGVALFVASTFFGLTERGSTSPADIEENIAIALRAQRIAAKAQPNAGTLSNLAIYEYFGGNFAAGDKAAKRALALSPKATKEEGRKQLTEFRKSAKRYIKQTEELTKRQQQEGGQPQNPFGGFGPSTPPPGG